MATTETTVVSTTLYRIAGVRNPDNMGGTIAKEVTLTLRAEDECQLDAMVSLAGVDGWHRKERRNGRSH